MLRTLKECGNTIVGFATYKKYGEEQIKNSFKEVGLPVELKVIDHGTAFDYSQAMRFTVVISNGLNHANQG